MFKKAPIIEKIISVLDDKRGCKRLGYNFRYNKDNCKNVDFKILFVEQSYIENKCHFTGLSCADLSDNTIYININRWRRGSKRSLLDLDSYRTYVINHEVGHILGRGHYQPGRRGSKVQYNKH